MKKILFIAIFIFPLLLLFHPSMAEAANRYVRQGATGSANGADWANAYTSLPATLVRGDTYYIADGGYGGYTFDDAISGTTYIYIKKATAAAHGTSTGWSNSYGDGTAEFWSWVITTSYWDIDGQVGQWADNMPDYIPYGFVVRRSSSANNQYIVNIGASGNSLSNILIKHANIYWTNTVTWHQSSHSIYAYLAWPSNSVFQYIWAHRGSGNLIYLHGTYITIDHSVLEENCTAGAIMGYADHCILLRLNNGDSNIQISNNVFRRWRSTGAVGLYGHNTDLNIFGNIWDCDAANAGNTAGNAPFCYGTPAYPISGMGNKGTGLPSEDGWGYRRIYVYNNTFADLGGATALFEKSTDYADVYMKNNIFYNAPTLRKGSVTPSYNWYYNSGSQSEVGVQIGAGNPFVNSANKDYRLSATTNAGTILGSPYDIDSLGATRGIDGIWDRGAYEYIASDPQPDITPPVRANSLPTGQLSAGTTQATLSLTTDENATCKYSLTAGTSYSAMTNTFSTTGSTNHSTNVSGLTNGSSYNYYIRCQDTVGNSNTTDFPVSFSIASGSSGNLLLNPSFEEGFTNNLANNWNITTDGNIGYSISQDTGYQGSAQKISISSPGSWGLFYYQTPSFQLNQFYNWSFWYKTQGTGSLWAQITNAPQTQVVHSESLPSTNGQWASKTISFQYTNSLANQLRFSSNATSSYWIDNIELAVAPPSQDTIPPSAPSGVVIQ